VFLLDSLMIAGIRWTLSTVVTAAEAELNDDSALRDRLLEAELQREMGEISDHEFAEIEADLLRAIREIKERRDGGSGAFAFGGAHPIETGEDSRFQVEAEVAGEFHGEPERADHPERAPGGAPAAHAAAARVRTARPGTARASRTPRRGRSRRTKAT
jgi:hypothetical protein